MLKMFNKLTGDEGEKIAVKYLKNKGYHILHRNYKNSIGEIDIIAKLNDIIIFVEVKRRKNNKFGSGFSAVDSTKQHKIKNTALLYISSNNIVNLCRFDVISIDGTDDVITHLENAFF